MSTDAVNELIKRLVQAGSLTAERFGALLGVPLQPGATDAYWTAYTFTLPQGPFARGELRLNAAGNNALLILAPRDPPGLGRADMDRGALGTWLGREPNPRIPPEGADTEIFLKDGVQVATQWTVRSRRLLRLALKWKPPEAA